MSQNLTDAKRKLLNLRGLQLNQRAAIANARDKLRNINSQLAVARAAAKANRSK